MNLHCKGRNFNFLNFYQTERVDRKNNWDVKNGESRRNNISTYLWSAPERMDVALRKGRKCWGASWSGCLRKWDTSAQPLDQGPHQPATQEGKQDSLGGNSHFQPGGDTSMQVHGNKAGPM